MRRGSCAYFGGARSWSATGLEEDIGFLENDMTAIEEQKGGLESDPVEVIIEPPKEAKYYQPCSSKSNEHSALPTSSIPENLSFVWKKENQSIAKQNSDQCFHNLALIMINHYCQ